MIHENPSRKILELILQTFDAHSVVLFQSEGGESPAHLMDHKSHSILFDTNAVIKKGKGVAGWLLKNKEPIYIEINATNREQLVYYTSTEKEVCSFMGCAIGNSILCVDSKKSNAFGEKSLALLEKCVEIYLEQCELFQKSISQVEVARYLYSLEEFTKMLTDYKDWQIFLKDFLPFVAEMTQFEFVAMFSVNHAEQKCYLDEQVPYLFEEHSFALEEGLVGLAFSHENPIYYDGSLGAHAKPLVLGDRTKPEFLSIVCLPIHVGGSVPLVLCMASSSPRFLSEELKYYNQFMVTGIGTLLDKAYRKI